MPNVLVVRAEGSRWVVLEADQTVVSSHPTQQAALEAAKVLAERVHGEVHWRDREGTLQFADYRLFTWLPRRRWWRRLIYSVHKHDRGLAQKDAIRYGDGQEPV
jgi:hypothetical protein